MSKFAWVTLATNDTYSLGALVLANSLKRVETAHQLAVLVTPGVSESMQNQLKDVYNVVQEVNVLDSGDAANLALLARPELGITFTKLHCWRLVQFEKCVFIDADALVLQNCDELFEREELSAAPDVSWPDCFNSGVFVYRPNLDTFAKITEFALKHGSFDGGDQGLLNLYFPEWSHKDINKHLPFTYNTTAYASYCYLPAFKQFRDKIKILHFAGKLKPWLVTFNSQNKSAQTPTEYQHASDLIQLWWNIFCDDVHQNLTDKMNFMNITRNLDSINMLNDKVEKQEIHVFNDPWEDYYKNLANQLGSEVEVEVKVADEVKVENQNEYESHPNKYEEEFREEYRSQANYEHKIEHFVGDNRQSGNISVQQQQYVESPKIEEFRKVDIAVEQQPASVEHKIENESFYIAVERRQSHDSGVTMPSSSFEHNNSNYDGSETSFDTNKQTNYSESSNETFSNNSNTTKMDTIANTSITGSNMVTVGLAGALSTLKLGETPTPDQVAYELSMRRQCWEAGNIDYTGVDSFDNIWKRITQTLESAVEAKSEPSPQPPTAAAPEQITTEEAKQEEDNVPKILTSADIEDGKIEYDDETNSKIEYKLIKGGYEVKTTTPQPNGTLKTQVRTFYDPTPVTAEEIAQKAKNRKPNGTIERIDKRTTVEYRDIEGGYEMITTVTNDDGTRSVKTQTIYDAVPQNLNDNRLSQKKDAKKLEKKKSVDKSLVAVDQRKKTIRKADSQEESNHYKVSEEQTVEEHRRVTQTTEISGKTVTSRKNSLQEQSIKSITERSTSDKKDTKKKKPKGAPAPPPDFVENDSTTVDSRNVVGGTEYTYTTTLEDGRTVTTTKIVYEEEETELTEDEIKKYKKQLKEAEKHKNVTKATKLKSESGTKKVVPSEKPGEVTTVETIQIDGGVEYHYTTVTAEGIVKKSTKTIYDAVPVEGDGSEDEQEIIEEYEEEIIEPGETTVKTIQSTRTVEESYQAETITTKKEKKSKKSAQ